LGSLASKVWSLRTSLEFDPLERLTLNTADTPEIETGADGLAAGVAAEGALLVHTNPAGHPVTVFTVVTKTAPPPPPPPPGPMFWGRLFKVSERTF
jgi:hypothetical protein